jgi:hypothetical protein
MKQNTILLISGLLICYGSFAQTEFTRQAQVDSFIQAYPYNVMYHHIVLRDDINVIKDQKINNLSGFNKFKSVSVSLMNFEWVDIPWFTGFENAGGVELINMPNLKTMSGIEGKMIDTAVFIVENCPSMERYPPKDAFGGIIEFEMRQIERDTVIINFTGIERLYNSQWSNKIQLYGNRIKYLKILDPNGAGSELVIYDDDSLEWLEYHSQYKGVAIKWVNNPKLKYIRGFSNTEGVAVRGVYDNISLSDLCVIREAIDNNYQRFNAQMKSTFNTFFSGNATGANSYEEIMAYDCSWVADTPTITGLNDNGSHTKLQVFPNPSRGIFNLLPPGGLQIAKVYLYNLQGREIPIQVAPNAVVSINAPNRGLYMLRVAYTTGEMETLKVMVDE